MKAICSDNDDKNDDILSMACCDRDDLLQVGLGGVAPLTLPRSDQDDWDDNNDYYDDEYGFEDDRRDDNL